MSELKLRLIVDRAYMDIETASTCALDHSIAASSRGLLISDRLSYVKVNKLFETWSNTAVNQSIGCLHSTSGTMWL